MSNIGDNSRLPFGRPLHLHSVSHNENQMIRKESIKRLINEVIHKKVTNQLESNGFKYAKSKSQFSKNVNKFKQLINISHYNASIYFDETNDLVQLHFIISSAIEVPRFEKWCEKEYGQKHRVYHLINNFKYHYNLSEKELSIIETFSPTKSQQFKANVSRAIAGNRREDTISFNEIDRYGFQLFESNLHLFCNAKLMYENRRNKNDLSYIRLLEFLGEVELAKKENIQNINFWKEIIEKTEFKSISDRSTALTNYNKRIDLVNQRFSTDLCHWNEVFEPFETDTTLNDILATKSIILNLVFAVKNPSSKIIGYFSIDKNFFQIREDGSTLKHNSQGQIIETIQVQGFEKLYPYNINTSRNGTTLYVANLAIRTNETVHLRYKTEVKGNSTILPIPFSQVYVSSKQHFAFLISNYKNHEIHFCDKNGKHLRCIELSERPIEIIPELQIILCVKEDKSCQVYDLEGDFKYSMPSNNARYTFKNKYSYNLNSNMFLSGWYYTKSQLYKLNSGELVKHLWAHPTHLKGYKELLYSDINHNFGMNRFKFSPKGDYVIGGADHGKYVAWTTNKIERVELIPNTEYLPRLEKAEIVEIQGQKMLKNRGNHMGEIIFIQNGNYFGFQINKDLLIWNMEFEHIETILEIGYVKQVNENLLSVENDGIYSVYEINHCD